MSGSTNILFFLILILFTLVAGSLIFIQIRGIKKADIRIQQIEQCQQQYQKLLGDIHDLEEKDPQNNAQKDIFSQLKAKRREAAETLRLLDPGLDERLSFLQVDEDLRQKQDRKDHESQVLNYFICQNCGSKIQGGDKFCANCGYRLQG